MFRLPAALLLLEWVLPADFVLPPRDPEPPQTVVASSGLRGVVVRDSDGSPIEGARVEPQGGGIDGRAVVTRADGSFELPDGPRCGPSANGSRGIDYLRVTAPGSSLALVDPCSTAPWASTVRLRPSATLVGWVAGLPEGHPIDVVVQAAEIAWPPRSGLTVSEPRFTGTLNAEGHFEIADVPAQVPLAVRHTAGQWDDGYELATGLVLAPGERREVALEVLPDQGSRHGSEKDKASGPWIPLFPSASAATPPEELVWFEVLNGGRLAGHFVGGPRSKHHVIAGGRFHVHGYRACNHLEVEPGGWTLVARDNAGGIGAKRIRVRETDPSIGTEAAVRPGALLRIDASDLEAPFRLTLSYDGLAFVDAEMLPGVVRYEVVPAGKVDAAIQADGSEATKRIVEATAGSTVTLRL